MSTRSLKKIKVCTGAGCAAWSSDVVAQKLETIKGQLKLAGYEVCAAKCMSRCGGGVSLDTPFCKKVFKLKDPDKVYDFVFRRQAAQAVA